MFYDDSQPEVFWCSYCGEKIWVQVKPGMQPESLVCDVCEKIMKRDKNKRNNN